MNKADQDFNTIWNQKKTPVVFLLGRSKSLLIRLPFPPDGSLDDKEWLKSGRRNHPKWSIVYEGWKVPKSWLDDVTERALTTYGKVYVIQPYHSCKRCAPACWNAEGVKCECSCLGENHGSGRPAGRWHIVSEALAIQWKGERYSCKLILPI